MRYLSWAYLLALFAFILLPVVTLVIFSFQDGRLPVPPFKGATLDWYREILTDRALMEALGNSLIVALLSALVALTLGFLAASGLARDSNSRHSLTYSSGSDWGYSKIPAIRSRTRRSPCTSTIVTTSACLAC